MIKIGMKGNVFIRFFLEGCLDIVLCAALNVIYIQENDIGYEFHTVFHATNTITLFALGLVIVVLPIWTLWFYCRNFKNWEDEHFEEKYGAVFEGLKKEQRIVLAYPMIFMTRRFFLVLIVTVFRNSMVVQLSVMLLYSTI